MNKKYSPDWRTQIERDKHRQAGELTWLDTYCYSRLGNIAPVTSTLIFTTIDCTLLMSQYPVFTVKNRELLPLLPLIELYRRIKPDLNLRGWVPCWALLVKVTLANIAGLSHNPLPPYLILLSWLWSVGVLKGSTPVLDFCAITLTGPHLNDDHDPTNTVSRGCVFGVEINGYFPQIL